MSLLQQLGQAKALRALDDALAKSLRRLDPVTPDDVLAAAALASFAVAQGHAAFDLSRPRLLVDAALPWPDADAWAQRLAASCFVATPESSSEEAAAAPLVLEGGLLYLRRYREYERRLALQLRRIAAQGMPASDFAAIAPLFATLFPDAGDDRQARAAALALRRALVLVTGGPGTGKTTTIARMLLLRIAQAHADGAQMPRIALAAPTGRAADRMAESLRHAIVPLQALGIEQSLLDAMPHGAHTLHRLLGTIPDSPRFRHHADNPLPFDIVVVDEASMVDLPLMCKLAEAVADGAQLVLLGDPDQLPSVEAGDVLAAILAAAGPGDALPDEDAEALQSLLGGTALAGHASEGGGNARKRPLAGHRIHLTSGWRQSETLDLAPLAAAIRNGDAGETLRLLRGGTLSNVHFHEGVDDPLQARPQLLDHWRALATLTDPADALARACRARRSAGRAGPGLAPASAHCRAGRPAGRAWAECTHRGPAGRQPRTGLLPRPAAAGHREQLSPAPVQWRYRHLPAQCARRGAGVVSG